MLSAQSQTSATIAPLSPRDEKILQVATTVFARRGFRNTDVQEIANLLDIGKATIYRAFGTKEELFFATVDYGMAKLSERMACKRSEPEDDSASAMEEGIFTFLTFFQKNPELIELLMQERSEFRDRQSHSYLRHWMTNSATWRARVQKRLDSGQFKQIDIDGYLSAMSALCYGTIFTNYFMKKTIDLEATAKMLTDIVLFGVLSDAERDRRQKAEK